MQTVLLILAGIAAVIILLLVAHIRIRIYLSKAGQIVIRYLFLRFPFDLYPKQEEEEKPQKPKKAKKEKSKAKKEKKKEKEGFFKSTLKEQGAVDGVVSILQLVVTLLKRINRLFSHCIIDRFSFSVEISEGDAAKTAITYGALSAVVYPVVGLINGMMPIKKQEVSLTACYEEKKLDIVFLAVVRIRLLYIITAALGVIKDFIRFKTKA